MSANNIHATLVDIGGRGALFSGPSGTGKTLLALHLYKRCHRADIACSIIADDQVRLENHNDELWGGAPETLKSKIEIRGLGIVPLPPGANSAVKIELQVNLTEPSAMVRLWDGEKTDHLGVSIRTLTLSTHQLEAAGNAVLAALDYPLVV